MDKKALYSENFRLRISDFDCYERLNISTVLDLAQDVAGKHADILKIGYNDLIKDNRIFVLLRTRLEILKYPSLYETVNVTTWPREKGRIDFDRDTIIKNKNDEELIKIQSKWAIIDFFKRTIVFPRNINYDLKECIKEKTFDTPFNKIEDFDISGLEAYKQKINFLDLDHNMHVNNINYLKYIMNIIKLPRNMKIKYVDIDYLHEIKENDEIEIFIKQINNIYLCKAIKYNETLFICKVEFE